MPTGVYLDEASNTTSVQLEMKIWVGKGEGNRGKDVLRTQLQQVILSYKPLLPLRPEMLADTTQGAPYSSRVADHQDSVSFSVSGHVAMYVQQGRHTNKVAADQH